MPSVAGTTSSTSITSLMLCSEETRFVGIVIGSKRAGGIAVQIQWPSPAGYGEATKFPSWMEFGSVTETHLGETAKTSIVKTSQSGCPPHRSRSQPLITLGDALGRTGYCARRVLGTNTHRPSINHLVDGRSEGTTKLDLLRHSQDRQMQRLGGQLGKDQFQADRINV